MSMKTQAKKYWLMRSLLGLGLLFFIFNFSSKNSDSKINLSQRPSVRSITSTQENLQQPDVQQNLKESTNPHQFIKSESNPSVDGFANKYKNIDQLRHLRKKNRNPSQVYDLAISQIKEEKILDDTGWKAWPNVKAKLKINLETSDQVLFEMGNMAVVKAIDEGFVWRDANSAEKSVVYYEKRRMPGYLTGQIIVRQIEDYQLRSLIEQVGLKINMPFPHLKTYFVSCYNAALTLPECFLKIKSIHQQTELEIFHKTYEKK